MLEKFDSKIHKSLQKYLPFGYESCFPYLDFAGYILERDGIKNIVIQDILYPNTFPYLYLTKQKANWQNSHILWTTKEQLELLKKEVKIFNIIPVGEEFFYKTSDFINPRGKKWSDFRRRITQFKNNYKYTIKNNYSSRKINNFIERWLENQKEKTISFRESYDFFNFCLQNKKKYNIKNLFIEVKDKLVGLALGIKFNKKYWVGLHLKIDYKYKGLSRFLHQKRAEIFSDCEIFTLGHSGARDKGIEQFKKELNPYKTIEHFYVITGDRLKK